jgi:hypothetical protein
MAYPPGYRFVHDLPNKPLTGYLICKIFKTKEMICKIFKTLELEQASCHCELEPGVQYRFYWEKTDVMIMVSLYTYRRLAQWFLWSFGDTSLRLLDSVST